MNYCTYSCDMYIMFDNNNNDNNNNKNNNNNYHKNSFYLFSTYPVSSKRFTIVYFIYAYLSFPANA